MAGNFGYELDLTQLTEEEKELVKKQVALYKEIREITQFGDFYRDLAHLKATRQPGILFQRINQRW